MQLQFFNHPEGYVVPMVVNGTRSEGSVMGFNTATGETTYSDYSYVFQYRAERKKKVWDTFLANEPAGGLAKGNIRLSYSDSDLNGSVNSSEIIEESNYYPFGLKQKGYNNTVTSNGNGLAQNWKFGGIELNGDLGLNFYEMDLRHYDPSIGRWTGVDPVIHYSMSPYNSFDNNPVYWSDPSGGNAVVHASTVVDKKGVVTSHIDDKDPHIYLENRFGPIVGREEGGKEYKKGDQIFDVDSDVDTFFELQLETISVSFETTKLVESLTEDTDLLNQIYEKVERGHPLSNEDISTIKLLLSRLNTTSINIARNKYKKEKLAELYDAYRKEIDWKEFGKQQLNSWINRIVNFGDLFGASEIPDGSGNTATKKVRELLKKDLGLKPSDFTKRHQKLPYSLNYYD